MAQEQPYNSPVDRFPSEPKENRREHFRVSYPVRDRPVFRAHEWAASVLDVSETGMRLRVTQWPTGDTVLATHVEIAGAIVFKESPATMVRGKVVRFDGEILAVNLLEPGVPFAIVLKQQRWLRARHPWGY